MACWSAQAVFETGARLAALMIASGNRSEIAGRAFDMRDDGPRAGGT